jgi:integrase
LYRDGKRESASFDTKAQAVAWAQQRDAELVGARLPDHTVRDALRRYAREVTPTHKGAKWELARIGLLERDPLASVRLPNLRPSDVSDWKLRRLESVSAASVAREMNLLRSVFSIAVREWEWLRTNPAREVKRPASPPSRKRRITPDEIDRVTLALGYTGTVDNQSHRVALAFLFALETAMRSGEILGLTWADVGPKSVKLPDTKNGDARSVPLSQSARDILAALPRSDGPVFGLDPAMRDALFRKAVKRAEIPDLHFHDTRSEAIWRLSKKLDVLQLARVIGHRDLKSLMWYYNESADDLADRL